jgi:beta-glucosidase
MKKILDSLTFEEKALLLSGAARMSTTEIERLGIEPKNFADGPHGVRHGEEENCTHFPNLCSLGASWDVEAAYKMGEGIALDCIEHDVDMILGPGINIKRNILCGRNFEYVSEDPILSGEMAAGYINGVQSKGVGTSLKHYALNNQE